MKRVGHPRFDIVVTQPDRCNDPRVLVSSSAEKSLFARNFVVWEACWQFMLWNHRIIEYDRLSRRRNSPRLRLNCQPILALFSRLMTHFPAS